MKRLAILHYHLRPGGVTTVIRNTEKALGGQFRINLLADFGYDDRPARSREAFRAEARRLMRRLAGMLRGCDILHTHNVGLGKHPRLTCAVKMLAEAGRVRIVNQVHDFPEHNRPQQLRALRFCTGRRDDSFWRGMCYYDLPNVFWATLTRSDAAQLADRGVPASKITILPNPVDNEFFAQPAPSRREREESLRNIAAFAREHGFGFDPRRKVLLSPMKVMARKHNAEAVELVRRLNALAGTSRYQLWISLEASSPADRVYEKALKRKVARERLPVLIGVGEVVDRLNLFHLAHAILTTSKVEGFGYAFIEGWLCGKLVVGRDIPGVTRDLVAEGMDLRHLYREFDDDAVRLVARLLDRPSRSLISHNRKVVLEKYSLAAYAERFGGLISKA